MVHMTDGERAIRKGARNIARLEREVAAERARLEQVQAIEALGEELIIKPLQEGLDAARARVAAHTEALAESDRRMAELKAKLAASKAKSKGIS